ncbi:MAG: hypothetical protein MIO90_03405 [Methanomassiliicoccales archaeon]|nr:hypothetical protein [Methanomassiliicoccales archaeon]
MQLIFAFDGGLMIWDGSLVRGVPYDIGFLVAWAALLLILSSILIGMIANNELPSSAHATDDGNVHPPLF